MNPIDLNAFISGQKSQLKELQDEYNVTHHLIEKLEIHKPIKWYNNVYYILKRVILYSLTILIIGFVFFIIVNKEELKVIFDNNLSQFITEYINDVFGIRMRNVQEIKSVFFEYKKEHVYTKQLSTSVQNKVVNQVFETLYFVIIVIGVCTVLLFTYVNRLTRKLYNKNKIIDSYYYSTLEVCKAYKDIIANKQKEIEFLTKFENNNNFDLSSTKTSK